MENHHSKEFRQILVDLCLETNRSCADVAKKYNLEPELVRR